MGPVMDWIHQEGPRLGYRVPAQTKEHVPRAELSTSENSDSTMYSYIMR